VVTSAHALVQDHLDEPIRIAELSQAVGVSERTLRNAFVDVCHQSPKRYFLKERLLAVREALRAAHSNALTVTAIATDHGFFELGRRSRSCSRPSVKSSVASVMVVPSSKPHRS
jgi:transcriptional regulator GlxA family with amidase domain